MRALVYEAPGVLSVRERGRAQPGPGEALLDVAFVGICGSDLLLWEGGFARVSPPVVVGHEFSGTVLATGEGVTLPLGTRVAVEPLLTCGICPSCRRGHSHICARLRLLGIDVDGAAAQQVIIPAERAHPIPDDLSLRDAALVEPTAVACHMAGRAGVSPGSSVLVVGGGPIGALVAMVSAARGAARVVISEPNAARRDRLAACGLRVIDPTRLSIEQIAETAEEGYDIAFELTAIAAGLQTAIAAARPGGTVLLGGLAHGAIAVDTSPAVLKELALVGARVYRTDDVRDAITLIGSGAVPASRLISRVVPLEGAVDDAYGRLRDDRNEMKILIQPNGAPV